MEMVNTRENCSIFLFSDCKHMKNTCDTCSVGFGKMRLLKVIKYKSNVTACDFFVCVFWSLFHVHVFTILYSCYQNVYKLNCYLKSQDILRL